MKYLVTGSTGKFGRHALDYLSTYVDKGDIVALVRDEDKGKALIEEGFEVRIADYSDPVSLRDAFAGVQRLLFVSSVPGGPVGRQEQHRNVVEAARREDVDFIAYTSIANAQESKCMLAPDHVYTEEIIDESGIDHVFLRNNWYLENEELIFKGALENGRFVHGAGAGRVGWALRREYAEAAARVLAQVYTATGKGVLELSGHPTTYAELAAALAKISGENFEVVSLDQAAYRVELEKAGLPDSFVGYLNSLHAEIGEGVLDVESPDFPAVLGRPLTPLDEALGRLV